MLPMPNVASLTTRLYMRAIWFVLFFLLAGCSSAPDAPGTAGTAGSPAQAGGDSGAAATPAEGGSAGAAEPEGMVGMAGEAGEAPEQGGQAGAGEAGAAGAPSSPEAGGSAGQAGSAGASGAGPVTAQPGAFWGSCGREPACVAALAPGQSLDACAYQGCEGDLGCAPYLRRATDPAPAQVCAFLCVTWHEGLHAGYYPDAGLQARCAAAGGVCFEPGASGASACVPALPEQ